MPKIGNIIYKDDLVNHTKVDYINYIKWSDDIEYNQSLPTLMVGWEFLKSLYPTNTVTILNKEIEKLLLYWEFSFEEKKSEHVSGVDLFAINVPYYYFRKNYTYINIDPIFNNIEHVEHISKNIIGEPEVVYNHKDEMLYILRPNRVYGIDLKMYEYFNMDVNHIKSDFINLSPKYIEDLDGSIYSEYYKSYPNFEELKRYLVVLLSVS